MNSFEKILKQYDYSFPSELIAQSPASPRDSAKLLVFDRSTGQINHDTYKNIAQFLPKNSVLVLNQTKVIPARLVVVKPTGGQARVLYIKTVGQSIVVLSDRKLEIGSTIIIPKTQLYFTVQTRQDQFYILKPSFKISELFSMLNKYGQTPLPPYIKHSKLKGKKLLQEYNTVFAKTSGSVAAPTASLHFTQGLFNKIKRSGIKIVYVTLHVNLGTFAPLTKQQLKDKKLHTEYYEISKSAAATLNKAKKSGQPIIAVGTTVVRTLESAAATQNKISKLSGSTSLFITEKTKLKFVDSIITNFHVPKSSLLMLVSSFINRQKLIALYKLAIQKKYRLFSFGDGMLIK